MQPNFAQNATLFLQASARVQSRCARGQICESLKRLDEQLDRRGPGVSKDQRWWPGFEFRNDVTRLSRDVNKRFETRMVVSVHTRARYRARLYPIGWPPNSMCAVDTCSFRWIKRKGASVVPSVVHLAEGDISRERTGEEETRIRG